MKNKLLQTFGSRLVAALAMVATLFITTKLMGPENKGIISLMILHLGISSIVSGFISGTSLGYYASRFSGNGMWLSVALSVVLSPLIIGCWLLFTDGNVGFSLTWFIGLAFGECLMGAQSMVLLGRRSFYAYNLQQVLKAILLPSTLLVWNLSQPLSVFSFTLAYSLSLAASVVYGFQAIRTLPLEETAIPSFAKALTSLLTYGAVNQSGNLAQLLALRLSFFALAAAFQTQQEALKAVGLFAAALQIAEALWIFSRSVSTVQFAETASTGDRKQALAHCLRLMRLNAAVTALGCLVVMAIPEWVFSAGLGEGFAGCKTLVLPLLPGVVAIAYATAINHFYSGLNEQRYNAITSIAGFVLTAVTIFPAVTYFGPVGAAWLTSAVLIAQLIMQLIFLRLTYGIRWGQLLPDSSDVNLIRASMSLLSKRFRA